MPQSEAELDPGASSSPSEIERGEVYYLIQDY
jgi:hypothetical protein